MKIINEQLLNKVSHEAKQSPRLRMNYNLHQSMDEPVHRLLNAVEPGTYLPPHRHSTKVETYVVLRGSLKAFYFNDQGEVTEQIELNPLKGVYGLDIPVGTWHTLVVQEPDTVIFEIKKGPYEPLAGNDLAPWAPLAADHEAAQEYLKKLRIL